jgi:hypothetical protein
MTTTNGFRTMLGITLGLFAVNAAADTANITAFVEKTAVFADSTRGGCVAALSKNPAAVLPACKKTWVTFSCDGTYTDPVRAYRLLDQAQLALATGLEVQVTVTDAKMHDGYCFASQIKVMTE